MDAPAVGTGLRTFGALLRQRRQRQRLSQLALALQAEVSARHLSWLETGRAEPSRAMVLRLAEQLDVPLRERNAWLMAAGFAPLYAERSLSDPAQAAARQVLQQLLRAHEPWPALAVDRHWHLVAHNRMVPPLLALVDPALRGTETNMLRLSLHPAGLAPLVVNRAAWRHHVLSRLARQAGATGDPVLQALWRELRELPSPGEAAVDTGGAEGPASDNPVAVPLVLRTPWGELSFLTTVTVFGAPHDITLAELAVETLLPANAATAAALRRFHEALPPDDADA